MSKKIKIFLAILVIIIGLGGLYLTMNFKKVLSAVSGVINVSARLAGVSNPVNSNDVVTKNYVDAASPLPGLLCPSQIDSSDRSAQTISNAITTCRNLGNNWRLPTVDELSCFIGISGASSDYLLTRTPAGTSTLIYYFTLNLNSGDWQLNNPYYTPFPFRCVR